MHIHDLLAAQGKTLFKWRSFIPVLLAVPAIVALENSSFVQDRYGDQIEDLTTYVCYYVSLLGLLLRCYTIATVAPGTSGRSTKKLKADSLNTTGMYSIVKNPLYLANMIIVTGILAAFKVWWFVVIGLLAFWIYIERIIAIEEGFLREKFGATYDEWSHRTPIFLPKFSLWRKPSAPFSIKRILRREYNGFLVIGLSFFLIEFVTDVFIQHETLKSWLADDWFWLAQAVLSIVLFFILRNLKKRTDLIG